MPIQLMCPNLRCCKILSVPDNVRGKLVKCQYCQSPFRVPAHRTGVTTTQLNKPEPAAAGAGKDKK